MFFYRKVDKEKINEIKQASYELGVNETTKRYKSKIAGIKKNFNNRIKKKAVEIKKLDKIVREVESKSEYLDKVEKVLYAAFNQAINKKLIEQEDIIMECRKLVNTKDALDLKKYVVQKKEPQLKDSVEDYKSKRLKLAE